MVRARTPLVFLVLLTSLLVLPLQPAHAQSGPVVVLEEVVTDPQQDWDGSGSITSSDEYVVVRNEGDTTVDLSGWRLLMQDSTPEEEQLAGSLAPGEALFLVNPIGLLNNDVRLQLFDAANTLVDEAALDGSDAPNGDASDRRDEAVHLHGPWAGREGPATGGTGLPALWVESVGAVGAETPAAFAPSWLPAAPRNLTIRLHVAPGVAPAPVLWVGDETAPLAARSDGTWTAGPFTPVAPEVDLAIHDDLVRLDHWPNGDPLRFRVDPAPPYLADEAVAVADATRTLRWVASFLDDHSGTAATDLSYEIDGNRTPLPACAWPADGDPACPLPENVTVLHAEAIDRVGLNHTERLAVVVDDGPPIMPSMFHFDVAVPPRFTWNASAEPLAGLVVETADDPGGTWNRTRTDVAPDARAFTDADWVPGAPRAYRLVATDRGGNHNATPWVALPPAAVPVQADLSDDPDALGILARGGSPAVNVTFDRPVAVLPRLVLESLAPTPFRTTAEGSAGPDGRSAQYVLAPEAVVPRTGNGSWRLVGGEGADGAPMAARITAAVWDHEAPRIDAAGQQDGWFAGRRQVLVVSAHDRGDPAPVLEVSAKAPVSVRAGQGLAEVVVAREGIHTVQATARDAAGNEAHTDLTLRLDGTAPALRLAVAPKEWTPTVPIEITVKDPLSGVDRDSVEVEVRHKGGIVTPDAAWNGSRLVLGSNGTHKGPFEIRLRVRDLAGNEAAGVLGERVTPGRLGMTVTINETQASAGDEATNTTSDPSSGGHFAPTSGEPVQSWSDLTGLPPTDAVPRTAEDRSEGHGMTAVVSGLVGAGLLGLGTVVQKRRRGRAASPTAASD